MKNVVKTIQKKERNIMKKLLVLVPVLGLLTGCMPGMRYPKTSEGIMQHAKITEDKFQNTKWVNFSSIRPNQMSDYKEVTGVSAWNVPAGYFYVRALQGATNTPGLVQVYFSTDYASEWGFYHSAVDSEKNKLKFVEIDREVTNDGGYVHTVEDFAINLDWEYLKARSGQNIIIKVYGKKQDFVFFIPNYYVDGVLKYFEDKK